MAPTDRDVLLVLYWSTGGPDWHDGNTNWDDAAFSEWYGVEVNGQGRVVKLDLDGNTWSTSQHGAYMLLFMGT